MKKLLILLAALLLAAFSAVVPAYAAVIRFAEDALKNAPENQGIDLRAVPSYALLPYKFKRDVVEKRAAQVFRKNPVTRPVWDKGFMSEEMDEDLIFSSGSIEFWVAKPTGAEILLDLDRYAVAEKQRSPLEEKRLKEIALNYIQEQIPDVNLGELRCAKVRKLMNASGQLDAESKTVSEVTTEIANYVVVYERLVGGIPVVGPGEQVRVYLSVNGDVIGHSKVWRQLGEKTATKPVLSTNEIKSIFVKHHANDRVEKIEVDRLYFGYFAEGRYTTQKSLGPYYILGYTYGPYSKRVFERYDAYTGELVRPPLDEAPGTSKEEVQECPPGCTCLTEAEAQEKFGQYVKCSEKPCGSEQAVGAAALVPKYCFKPVEGCPAGCTCLSKEEGYNRGLDFCRDEKGNPVRCGVISEVYGEYKYCFQTGGECRYDYEKNVCVGPCPKGQVCQLNTIYRDPKTGKVTYAECHCKALPKEGAFRIGQRSCTVDGQVKEMDVAPFIRNSRTYTPVRYLAYALGLSDREIAWDPVARRVTLTRGAVKVELLIGRPVIIVNGEEQPIDVAPLIEQGRTFLPARFVVEAFGGAVAWDPLTQTVNIGATPTETSLVNAARIKQLTTKVHTDFRQLVLVQKLPVATALAQQKGFLLAQPEVQAVEELTGGNLLVTFKNGYRLLMLLGKDTLGSLPAAIPPVTDTIIKPPPGVWQYLMTCHPKSNKALIFDCLEDDMNAVTPKISQQLYSDLEAMGYTVTVMRNDEANLFNAALIDDGSYGVVFLRGHGGVVGSDFAFLVRPWYEDPPPWNSGYTGTIPASAFNHAAGKDQFGYCITGQFASTYWTNKAFPDTLFFLESCHGADPAGIPGMPTWTVNHGASVWLGWNASVSLGCGDNGTKLFFDQIKEGKNVGELLDAVFATGCRPPDLVAHPSGKDDCKLAAWGADPNEIAVADAQDFKLLKLVPSRDESQLEAGIEFYGAPNLAEFFFYVDTTGDAAADVLVRCHPANFEVYRQTSPGWFNTKVYTGTPVVSGKTYSLAVPWETAFGSANPVKVWLYDMTGKDRLPDSGSVALYR
ncbi:copper amine oxidase N-terminal domain-containing protein [Thermodesulfitimonas autotrophica]|uniref:copper amine oxidase N-terminal domain-containing protein n=1 Tax=Thermodesulfitimonas autotrophica TaxID=1894989 RepID=UPI002FE1428D